MDIQTITAWPASVAAIGFFSDALKHEFFTSAVGSLLGAWGGAYGAQRIAERNKDRDELLRDIKAANALISTTFHILNEALAFKSQHAQKMFDDFEKDRIALSTWLWKRKTREIQGNAPASVRFPMQRLPELNFLTEPLQKQGFESLNIGNRPLAAISALIGACKLLLQAIFHRNEMINRFRNTNAPEKDDFAHIYFGLPMQHGTDTEYADTLRAILSYTNDVIFFSHLICEDVHKTAKENSEKLKKLKIKVQVKKIEVFESKKQLIPPEKDYESWLIGFNTDE